MTLTEFERSILIGVVGGFGSGIFSVILDYIYAKFVQKLSEINLTEFFIKAIFLGFTLGTILGLAVWIEVNYSTDLLSIEQINKSTIILAVSLPLINFVVDKFFGFVAARKPD